MATQNYTVGELEEMVSSEDWHDRYEAARQGFGLDRLVDDICVDVRKEVACQGYGLDKLVDDKYLIVRKEVAKAAGKVNRIDLLKKLQHDEDDWVRGAAYIADSYILSRLIDNKNDEARLAILRTLDETLKKLQAKQQ